MNSKELLLAKIRPVTENDKGLPMFSYSGLSMLKQCPYQFDLKYNQNKRSTETTLALSLGTLLHYILEQKGKMLKANKAIDYDLLYQILENGTTQTDEKTQENILGLTELKKMYWESWAAPDSEGRTYDEKIKLFDKVLKTEMEIGHWKPYLFEHPFEFVYDNKVILHGFIDRVDKQVIIDDDDNLEVYRVVDYKTNKKPYDSKELATSLQFGIYALAILNEFKEVPREYQYRLILLDKEQNALTLGWQSRLITALDGLINDLDERKANDEWTPKPTPLCHWCNYCATNDSAKEYKYECPYYSLWTPNNKTYDVFKKYEGKKDGVNITTKSTGQTPRKVIF